MWAVVHNTISPRHTDLPLGVVYLAAKTPMSYGTERDREGGVGRQREREMEGAVRVERKKYKEVEWGSGRVRE